MSDERITQLERNFDKLATTVRGEDGNNGLRSSVNRAHTAVKENAGEIAAIKREIAELKSESMRGDNEMKDRLIERIDTVDRELTAKIDHHRVYQNRMLITILLAVIGSIIMPVVM